MNSYTLYFSDPKKEKEFQLENMNNIRKILLYLFNSLIFFVGSIYLIFGSFKTTYTLILGIGVSVYNLIAISLTYFKIINYQTLLILCNITILLLQFIIYDYTISQSFLRGSITMMMHCSIIYICDFPQALLQIFVMFLVKLLYVAIIEELPFQLAIAMSLTATFLAANCYRLIKINRTQFLLRLSSNNWGINYSYIIFLDNILNRVIENRYCYFTYNAKKCCFTICQSNMFERNQDEFLEFLRKYRIGKKTLEQYIFQDIKDFGSLDQKELKVKNGKETQKITLISFFIESPNFIVMLDNENRYLKLLNKQVSKLNKYCKSTLSTLSLLNLKFLHQGIEKENRFSLLKLRYIYFKYLLKSSQQKIRTFNLSKLMNFITSIIYIKDRYITIQPNNQNIQITTIYSQFLFLLIEILESYTSNNIEIIIDQTSVQGITLQFIGILNPKKIQFSRYYQILSDNHYQINKNQNQLIVQLNQDISYMNQISTERFRSPKHVTIPFR